MRCAGEHTEGMETTTRLSLIGQLTDVDDRRGPTASANNHFAHSLTTVYYWLCFFQVLTSPGQVRAAPSLFIVSRTKVSRFLTFPESGWPMSIQKLSGSVAWKPDVVGGVSSISQSNTLFANYCFVPDCGIYM